VVGDPGVHAQLYGGEAAQVGGDLGGLDALGGGEGPVLRRDLLQVADLLLNVAAGDVAAAAVQSGRPAVDAAYGVRRGRFGGRRGGGDRGGGAVLRRRGGEGVGAGLARGLEEDLAVLARGTVVGPGEDDGQDDGGDDRGGEDRDPGCGLPPGAAGFRRGRRAAAAAGRLGGRARGRLGGPESGPEGGPVGRPDDGGSTLTSSSSRRDGAAACPEFRRFPTSPPYCVLRFRARRKPTRTDLPAGGAGRSCLAWQG
jgi:hypothetical protein